MQLGDVYRNDPVVFASEEKRDHDRGEYGTGPFLITRISRDHAGPLVYVKSLEDGRCHGPWSHPRYWGVLDTFLTAAHKATQ